MSMEQVTSTEKKHTYRLSVRRLFLLAAIVAALVVVVQRTEMVDVKYHSTSPQGTLFVGTLHIRGIVHFHCYCNRKGQGYWVRWFRTELPVNEKTIRG